MSEPQLILIGGTLSASKNAAGLLVPAENSLDEMLERVGFDPKNAIRPFTIDSIDFDMSTHYPLLRDAALKTLQAGKTPVVCGGTDSMIWYSTLLTKDLMRHGHLQPDSREKVIFLSSMKSLDSGREHVENILKGGRLLVDQSLSGGFAICAENEAGDSLAIHNVCDNFDKISSSLIYAFRSQGPVGLIMGNKFSSMDRYQPITCGFSVSDGREYARIAPPFLMNQDSEALLAYLKVMGSARPPFDGILIEGPPQGSRLHRNDRAKLISTVRQLHENGIRVMFCNPLYFSDKRHHDIKPVIDEKLWDPKGFSQEIKDAGGEFTTALTKDAYIDMVLSTPSQSRNCLAGPGNTVRRQKELRVRYIPNHKLMAESIPVLATLGKNLTFSALPHSVLPNALLDVFDSFKRITNYWVFFEHNGNKYFHNGAEITEGEEGNPYAAGQDMSKMTKPIQVNPAKAIPSIYVNTNGNGKPGHAARSLANHQHYRA